MKIETIETKTTERLLVYEDAEAIREYSRNLREKVQRTCDALNAVNELLPIASPTDIPANVDDYIFKKFLEGNKQAKALHEISPLSIATVKLPEELQALRKVLNNWKAVVNNDALPYIFKKSDGFEFKASLVDSEIDAYAETKREYVTDPEQIDMINKLQEYLSFVFQYRGHFYQYEFNNPMLRLNMVNPQVEMKNHKYPFINLEAVRAAQSNRRIIFGR